MTHRQIQNRLNAISESTAKLYLDALEKHNENGISKLELKLLSNLMRNAETTLEIYKGLPF